MQYVLVGLLHRTQDLYNGCTSIEFLDISEYEFWIGITARRQETCGTRPGYNGPTWEPQHKYIAEGIDAKKGQFPWMVFSLSNHFHVFQVLACGAAIVDNTWVISARHCFEWEKQYISNSEFFK